MSRRPRRKFTEEQKQEAVRLVQNSNRSTYQVAQNLDLSESALRRWVKQSEIEAGRGTPGALTSAEREELQSLRRETKRLRMERDFLKKAAAFFAKDSSTLLS